MKNIVLLILLLPLFSFAQSTETFFLGHVLINGKVDGEEKLSLTDVNKIFGKPDKVVDYKPGPGEEPHLKDEMAFYHGVAFHTFNGFAAFHHLVFSKGSANFVLFDSVSLSAHTTIEEVKSKFKYRERTDKKVYSKRNVKTIVIENIRGSKDDPIHQTWILTFRRGHLVSFAKGVLWRSEC